MLKYLALFLLLPTLATAKPYTIDATKSNITFNVTHSGKPVAGKFEKWEAKIDFDAGNLPASKIDATIYTGSAHTGESVYDGTLPSSDWLDSGKFPKATFVSTGIDKAGEGKFIAHGVLTLKGRAQNMDLPFTLAEKDGTATASGEVLIDRLAANIGTASDPKAQWVSKDVKLLISIVAKPTPTPQQQ